MRKFFLAIIILLITVSYSYAWYLVHVDLATLKSIYFTDSQTGYVVNSQGGIAKTTNSGTSWIPQTSGVTTALNCVYFINSNVGFAIGNNGKILKTLNGGNTWNLQSSGVTSMLNSVYFTDLQTGYIVGFGGKILKTTDGGTTWNQQTSGTGSQLKSVYFINNSIGFVVGLGGIILKTIDAGQTWTVENSGTTKNLLSIHFVNNIGYIGGYGTLLKTINSGSSWSSLNFPLNQNISSLFFTNETTGYAAVYDGIIKTVDGGLNWRYLSFYESGTSSVFFVNDLLGFAITGKNIYKTDLGGGYYDNENLSVNNINAKIYCNDYLFWERNTSLPAFEVPKGSGKHSNFASSLWIGGIDINGQLRAAGHRLGDGDDFFPGPIMNPVSYISDIEKWNRVWKVTKPEILYHIDHWSDTGYEIPSIIAEWPGNGDTSKGQLHNIAPFVDLNNDGLYAPEQGDYPLIKGDEAIFFIFNDYMDTHTESSGAKIGMEVHAMAYAFNCPSDSAFWNTIFINYKLINRAPYYLYHFYAGIFSDIDVGEATDDFVECDVSRSSFFGFNSDNLDGDGNGKTYGANPPAQSIVILGGPYMDPDTSDFGSSGIANGCDESINGLNFNDGIIDNERLGMTNFKYFLNSGNASIGIPSTAVEFYYYLREYWKDGTRLTYGGTGYTPGGSGIPANFAYPGDPTSDSCGWGTSGVIQPGWSIQGYPLNNYCSIASSGPISLYRDSVNYLDFAFVFGRNYSDPDARAGVAVMKQRIDSVRKGFIIQNSPCGPFSIGIKENKIKEINIYPNPANYYFDIKTENNPANKSVYIYTIEGVLVKESSFNGSQTRIYTDRLSDGLYIVEIRTLNGSHYKKIIVTK